MTGASRILLYCLPSAGSGPALYRNWPQALPDGIDCRPLAMAGREARGAEAPATCSATAVTRLADEFTHSDGRFAVFGHSMGALLAFELTREWRRRGERMPAWLFLSACPGPRRKRRQRPLHGLPRAELLAALAAMGGTPREILAEDDLMDLLIPTIRADFELCETHRHRSEPPLNVPITVLAGDDDPLCTADDALDWRGETAAAFDLKMFDGDHFFLRPRIAEVVALIASRLLC